MKDRDTNPKTQGADKSPAQNLAYGLFGRRVAARTNAETANADLTGKAA